MPTPSRYPPSPHAYGDWKSWADSFVAYSAGGAVLKQPAEPSVVVLAHQLGDVGNIGGERAITDGILMWNAQLQSVVVSKNGQWVQLAEVVAP